MSTPSDDPTAVALAFATALTRRDFDAAYAMTARDYQRRVPVGTMREAFAAIVPAEFGSITSVDAGMTMDSWPDKQPSDVAWVYVSVGGDVFSEAVIVIVASEDGSLKVRDVEFGRP